MLQIRGDVMIPLKRKGLYRLCLSQLLLISFCWLLVTLIAFGGSVSMLGISATLERAFKPILRT